MSLCASSTAHCALHSFVDQSPPWVVLTDLRSVPEGPHLLLHIQSTLVVQSLYRRESLHHNVFQLLLLVANHVSLQPISHLCDCCYQACHVKVMYVKQMSAEHEEETLQ